MTGTHVVLLLVFSTALKVFSVNKCLDTLLNRVETTEGVHCATLVEVMSSEGPLENREDPPHLTSTENLEDEVDDSEDYDGPYSDVRLIVSEGKYRMVR